MYGHVFYMPTIYWHIFYVPWYCYDDVPFAVNIMSLMSHWNSVMGIGDAEGLYNVYSPATTEFCCIYIPAYQNGVYEVLSLQSVATTQQFWLVLDNKNWARDE